MPRFVARIERRGVLELGPAVAVTLTVVPEVDLDAVGEALGDRSETDYLDPAPGDDDAAWRVR